MLRSSRFVTVYHTLKFCRLFEEFEFSIYRIFTWERIAFVGSVSYLLMNKSVFAVSSHSEVRVGFLITGFSRLLSNARI